MIKNGLGGGNTVSGLIFENNFKIAFEDSITINNKDSLISFPYKENNFLILEKGDLYSYIKKHNIKWENFISRKILPDKVIINLTKNKIFILELKCQNVEGSVDEKLQTCDFKKKQYKKLLSSITNDVSYIYILNDWFKKEKYKDVLDYIKSVGCNYFFNEIDVASFA